MNGIIANVQVKGCCKSETIKLFQICTDFGYWKRLPNQLFIYFHKITYEAYIAILFCIMKEGDAHYDAS